MRLDRSNVRREIARHYPRIGGETLPLGMGCATIGRETDADGLKQIQATLAAAYQSGLRYFDTSAQYGGSEFRVGTFLRGVPRAGVFVATKSPLPDALTPDEAFVFMRQAVRNSRERLGGAQIDLFQIHDVHRLEAVLADGGALDALRAARDAGEIRYIGLATRFHDLLRTATGDADFDTILTYRDYLPVHAPAAPLIAAAAERGKGVINGSPLAFGLLTGEGPRHEWPAHSENRSLAAAAGRLYDLCTARNWPLLGVALRFPMRNPHISITLTGPGSVAEWEAAKAALATPIPEDGWREIEALLPSEGNKP